MDHIDREILQILQHNARASLKMIAEKTFLSSPAVSARIEKLEKDGIITSDEARIPYPCVHQSQCASGGQAEILSLCGRDSKNSGMQQRDGRIFCDHESCFCKYDAARQLPWSAPEIRKDQHAGGIRHPRRSERRAGTGLGIHTKHEKDI